MALIDIDKFVCSLMRRFGYIKSVSTGLADCLKDQGLKYIDKPDGGYIEPIVKEEYKLKAGNWYVCNMEVANEQFTVVFHRDECYYCPKDGYLLVCGLEMSLCNASGCFRIATAEEIPQGAKQKSVEWSEEDEKIRKSIIDNIERRRMASVGSESAICENQIDWLKSLRPQKQWKPSEEQISALHNAIDYLYDTKHFNAQILYFLEEIEKQLKAL